MKCKQSLSVAICLLALLVSRTAGAAQDAATQFETLPLAAAYVLPEKVENPLTPDEKANNKKHAEVSAVIKAAKTKVTDVLKGTGTRDAAFDAFFKEYVFPAMAQTDDATTSRLGSLRAEFIKSYISSSTPANRTMMIETVSLPMCKQLASGNYHPSVRLNAVYLASLLEDRDANAQAGQFPVPNKQAVAFLTSLCQAPDSPGYLVAAAVGSLNRVAEIEAAESHQIDLSAFRTYCQSVLNGSAPGQNAWDADLAYWMRKRSIQSLGLLRDSSSLGLFTAAVVDSANPFLLRLAATQSIGQLDLASSDPKAVDSAAMGVVRFAHDSLSSEATGIRNTIEDLVAINLLWNDKYLIDPNYQTPTDGGAAGGGGDIPDDMQGLGGSGQGLGDSGRGGGGDDGRGGGDGARGGDGGAGNPNMPVKKIKSWREYDLPNYHLNMVRRRCKVMLHVCQTTLSAIARSNRLSADVKTTVDRTVGMSKAALLDANEGLVDLGAKVPETPAIVDPRDKDKPKTSSTIKLMELFQARAEELNALLPQAVPAEASAGPTETSAPSGTGS